MKVLFLINDPTILDLGSSAHSRAKENAIAIGELHVLVLGAADEERDEGSLRIQVLKRPRMGADAALKKAALRRIQNCSIDAVWVQDPFELGAIAAAAAKEAGLPYYVTVKTDFLSPWYAERTGLFRSAQVAVPKGNAKRIALARQTLPDAAGIRVMSERVKEGLVKEFGASIPMPEVIPVGVHAAPPVPSRLPVMYPFTLVAAGRLDAGRRVVDIIDALALIKDKYPGIGLFVIGDGPERASLEKRVRRKGLGDRVEFLGERRDTWGLIRCAHAFVQASAHEGYGRRLLQAALARVPIITTDVGIVGEAFKGYDDVLAFPPGDPTALSVHMVGLMEDVQARQLLAMNAEASAKRYLQEAGNIPERIARFLATPRRVT